MSGKFLRTVSGYRDGAILQAFEILEIIESTTSRNEKERALEDGENNDVLRHLLYCTYNPFRMYNVKKDPDVKPQGTASLTSNYNNFTELLEDLHSRYLTGNEALEAVQCVFSQFSPDEYKWYLKVLQKDLKIGITDKTINKVFEDLIPTFECMLAHPLKKFPKRFIVDRKLDGYRCLAFNHGNGHVELRTRNGNLIEGYTGIEDDVRDHTLPGFVYDGEIMSGSFNDTQKAVFKKGVKGKQGVLNMFDMLPIDEFENGESDDPLITRITKLNQVVAMWAQQGLQGHDVLCLDRVTPSRVFTNSDEDIQEVYELHKKFVAEGYEGTMVKDVDAPYQCKRTYAIQKIKDMETDDLTVIGVEEGKKGTKYEGTLGALVVDYYGFKVNVGSGYTDEERNDFWARRTDLINRTVEVQFQQPTTNKKDGKSLRFPVFIRFRDDK